MKPNGAIVARQTRNNICGGTYRFDLAFAWPADALTTEANQAEAKEMSI
jgi:hypothetical protein